MNKISLLVPSRERLNLKLTLISSIITTVKNINNVELIFGIDEDDPTKNIVKKISDAIPFVKIIDIQNNKKFIGINKIWNLLYPHAEGNILGYIGDDMVFKTENWDEKIIDEFNQNTASLHHFKAFLPLSVFLNTTTPTLNNPSTLLVTTCLCLNMQTSLSSILFRIILKS